MSETAVVNVERAAVRRAPSRAGRIAYAVPLAVIAALFITYTVSPDFYARYVLHIRHRESQAVEIATAGFLVIATVTLAWSSARLWARSRRAPFALPGAAGALDRFGAAAFVTAMLAAAVFFLGEELNWGQTITLWINPSRTIDFQTNLHNNVPMISLQGLGSLCVAIALFGVPLAWARREPLGIPASFRPAVPEGPVIFCAAVAFGWKWFKDIYRAVRGGAADDAFYVGFVEQINEHKELLIAVAFALYGLYRLRATREQS